MTCSASPCTNFCIIGTSVMNDSRRSSSTYTESGMLLHVVKHLPFLFFFSICFLFHKYSRFTGQQLKGEAIPLYPFYHLHPLHRHLYISWIIAAESSPLHIAGRIEHGTYVTRSLEFTFSTPALVAAVVRKMLKAQVKLGNIFRVLISLTKRLIFVMFKELYFLSLFTELTFIFSLYFTNYGCF